MNKKNLTAFFGGSFNPPHNGHLGVAQGALNSGLCSKVIWVPSWSQPHKQDKKAAPFHHRLAMVNLLIEGTKNMFASDLEERIKLQPSYTFEVLKHFAAELPDNEEAALLIGADSLLELHTWHRAQELAERFELLVYPRPNCTATYGKLLEKFPPHLAEKLEKSLLDGEFFEISSTLLRFSMEKSANWDNIISMTPGPVAEYCRRHGLYTNNRSSR